MNSTKDTRIVQQLNLQAILEKSNHMLVMLKPAVNAAHYSCINRMFLFIYKISTK